MNLVIEEINRSKKVLQRYRFKDKNCIRIGRALDNDIILNEPHVSPYHAELKLNDVGQWVIQDLNSINGIRNHSRKAVENGSIIESGDTYLLGRSYISIWREDHPVEEAWPLHSVEDLFHRISAPWVLALLVIGFVYGEWLLANLSNYRELSPSRLTNQIIYQLLVAVGWATAWSLSGRVIRHESRFYSHLAVTFIAAILMQWAPFILKILSFNGGYGLWNREILYFINGALFSLLLWCNFYLSMPQRPVIRIIWSNALAWGVVLIYLLPPIFDARSFRAFPMYDSSILPPSVFWADTMSPEQFLQQTEQLYGKDENMPDEAENSTTSKDSDTL
ncbi:FHA domain-containing protein [Pleionea sediminis]|uniref:FHA domain-containing protein n=1 Tax=Pleionea sediminis TaxID=2569479 RepID=UPI001185AB2A|nr:FHA domain-containing protein [Pleionea sediminis]